MNEKLSNTAISHFLNDVTEQISYRPLRPSIRQELEDHIQDRVEEYKAQGLSPDDARCQALKGMGDAVTIGTELNEAHKIQRAPIFAFVTLLLLLIGIAASAFMQWTPEQSSNGFFYYIPGGILLLFTAIKGYPFLIRHRKKLALFTGGLYLSQLVISPLGVSFGFASITIRTAYFAILMLIPVLTVLLYSCRQNKKKFLFLLGCAGICAILIGVPHQFVSNTATMIFMLSVFGTICFMIHRGILFGRKKYLYTGALIFLVLLGSPLFLTSSGRMRMTAFLSPEATVNNTWNDDYNSILIQELLFRTPFMTGLELSSEEMMDYGTGAWYFASRDPKQIGIDATGIKTDEQQRAFRGKVDALREAGYSPHYIHYRADQVTLWDILPQHYHNNYLIALCIFLFGWLPGLVLIGAILLFYFILFWCITRIHGPLSASLAFSCGQCLLWQGVFYLLGNFGYQYATFPNLPLISEGRISIILIEQNRYAMA